jgi:integrase
LPSDIERPRKDNFNHYKHIPESVLNQLFKYLHHLPISVQGLVITMLKTGLRISYTLEFKQECLIKLDGKYWIETDISKTNVKNHRIPIDDETTEILGLMIDNEQQHFKAIPKSTFF